MPETITHRIAVLEDGAERQERATLPREQPFTIQVRAGRQRRNAAETTRTPGHDYELAAGLLYAAGYIHDRDDFSHMTYCVGDGMRQEYNLLTVALRAARLPTLPRPEEVIVDGTSCGVSSDTLLAALAARERPTPPPFSLTPAALLAQAADPPAGAAFLDANGELQVARTDVRPLQALDKLLGWAVLGARLPLPAGMLWLPAAADYAMLERAVLAGAAVVVSRGQPSSLAISTAHRHDITLLAVRPDAVLTYTGRERLQTAPEP
ncbi:MAG: formate dehydrogenase accessory sulfurtransferase FdhD [Anaerolineae bacterium]|nr:formate dehydrogenase accessory sulfurtransferase FdhD [Anaerolineae bacterium]